ALSPTPNGFLGLPIVQDLHLVGFRGVVRQSKRIGFVGSVAEIAPTDPRSSGRAPVIAKTKALGDFHEVGCPAHPQPCSPCAGLQMGVAGVSRPGGPSPSFLQYTGPNGAEQA